MGRPASAINTEFDSRILRVSTGFGGVTRPRILSATLEQVFCLHCGKSGGGATANLPAALKGDPGLIYICGECEAKVGQLPTHATSFVRYKEG